MRSFSLVKFLGKYPSLLFEQIRRIEGKLDEHKNQESETKFFLGNMRELFLSTFME